MNDVISHASFGEIARFKFLFERRMSERREACRLGDDESFSVLYVICVKLYLFHITKPLKTSNFFPAALSIRANLRVSSSGQMSYSNELF